MQRTFMTVLTILALSTTAQAFVPLPQDPGFPILGVIDADRYGQQADNAIFGEPFSTHEIYFIVLHPEFGAIGGVEFAINFEPPQFASSYTVLSNNLPPLALLLQPQSNDYIIGFNVPPTYFNSQVVVLHQTVMLMTTEVATMHLGPASIPTFPGEMAFNNWNNPGQIEVLKPASEGYSHEAPIFGINTQVVATESTTWGGVKALFAN
jgi:hypothetical protein